MSFPDFPDDLFICDVEAGGLDPAKHSIIEVGVVHVNSGSYYSTFIREDEMVLSPYAEKIHGISEETLEEQGLRPRTVCWNLIEFLADCAPGCAKYTIGGFNVGFDESMMRRLFRLGGETYPFSHRSLDLHAIAYALKVSGKLPAKLNSDALFRHFDIGFEGEERHRALGDALATEKLLRRLIQEMQ